MKKLGVLFDPKDKRKLGGLYDILVIQLRKKDHLCSGSSTQNRRVVSDIPIKNWAASLKQNRQRLRTDHGVQ